MRQTRQVETMPQSTRWTTIGMQKVKLHSLRNGLETSRFQILRIKPPEGYSWVKETHTTRYHLARGKAQMLIEAKERLTSKLGRSRDQIDCKKLTENGFLQGLHEDEDYFTEI